jgi:hypothetical protein
VKTIARSAKLDDDESQQYIRVVNFDTVKYNSVTKSFPQMFIFKLCSNSEDEDGTDIIDEVTSYLSSKIKVPFVVVTRDVDMFIEGG